MHDGFYMAPMPKAMEQKNERAFLNVNMAEAVLSYHKSFPQYAQTPLIKLHQLANSLGLGALYVKDESCRFGLNAFKVLGGSYAMGRWIAQKLGFSPEELSFEKLTSQPVRQALGEVTFVCATDGNHGRGVAWTAKMLKQKAVIYLPRGTAKQRLDSIRTCGAQAYIMDMNYDACVRLANQRAREEGWVLVQDTAWDGYEEMPSWIMQGYTSMVLEALRQLGDTIPTHVFLQAGVGSMAGAAAGLMRDFYGDKKPLIIVVEPNRADCLFGSAAANDGKLHVVTGDMDTIMAGLACGEPCTIAWEVLKETADFAVSCPDWVAALGMRVLGSATGHDEKIVSGESGAVTSGLAAALMQRKDLARFKETLRLGSDSIVLCFSTEGDTDKKQYREIVHHGKYPSTVLDTGHYDENQTDSQTL
ncbi:MAG: diaminopropionate ammonia-lyase [Clostridiales bacterium]|nr:diaminopropionate ammonia-lyase [Clostridiales bacterium]